MRLYDVSFSTDSLRIRVALAEKGLADQVEFVETDVSSAAHDEAAFADIYPGGAVPILELDDGTFVSGVNAITEHLDNLDGSPVLTGATQKERALVQRMQRCAEQELLYALGSYFYYGTPGGSIALEAFQLPLWDGRAEWAALERERAVSGMHYFDGVLATQPYVAGDRFSMADITLWSALHVASSLGIDEPPGCESLRAWHSEMCQRPAIRIPA
ncbi:glutathione S-transferase N-terminal domain-containing protein [Cupriavidus necator]|uniref:glutathione S-transferase family protein n=1 Tax=Cupriavidus necator TaxID=106590 RepID=UPI0039C236C8